MARQMHLIAQHPNGTFAHVSLPVPAAFEHTSGQITGEFLENTTYDNLPGEKVNVDAAIADILVLWKTSGKFHAIKYIRMYTLYTSGSMWPLKESKDFAENLCRDLNG